ITTHLSGVFCPSDAPLVNLHDICSGYSLETSENGYESTSVEYWSGTSTSFRTADVTGSTDDDLEDSCQPDPMVATVLDVAVIRALLITHWQEQGIYWAMRYLLNRLEQIQNHIAVHGTRNRSNSLPSGERKPSTSIGLLSYSITHVGEFSTETRR
ncbi:hypothetical protein OSTOST_17745, partial [Ostertagia ostertagi]